MNRKTIARSMLAMLVAISLAAGIPAAAQMGTMGEAQMSQMPAHGGYGPGSSMMGMGPGMMGMGPGMMGMGPGMMGMGPGMMGMVGLGPIWMLDLSDEQRRRITLIQDEMRKQHWEVMGKIMEEHNKLRDLYEADELDAKKIGAVYESIARLHRQMVEAHVQAINRARGVLTPQQREQLKQWRRGGRGMMGGGGMGPGGMDRSGAPAR